MYCTVGGKRDHDADSVRQLTSSNNESTQSGASGFSLGPHVAAPGGTGPEGYPPLALPSGPELSQSKSTLFTRADATEGVSFGVGLDAECGRLASGFPGPASYRAGTNYNRFESSVGYSIASAGCAQGIGPNSSATRAIAGKSRADLAAGVYSPYGYRPAGSASISTGVNTPSTVASLSLGFGPNFGIETTTPDELRQQSDPLSQTCSERDSAVMVPTAIPTIAANGQRNQAPTGADGAYSVAKQLTASPYQPRIRYLPAYDRSATRNCGDKLILPLSSSMLIAASVHVESSTTTRTVLVVFGLYAGSVYAAAASNGVDWPGDGNGTRLCVSTSSFSLADLSASHKYPN